MAGRVKSGMRSGAAGDATGSAQEYERGATEVGDATQGREECAAPDWFILCPVQLALPFSRRDTVAAGAQAVSSPAPAGAAALAPVTGSHPSTRAPDTVAARPAPGHAFPEPFAPLYVRHRRARRYVLRVDNEGRVRITIPRGGSKREAEAFAARHERWIALQRARLAPRTHSPDDRRAARARAVVELPERLRELATELGLQVARVSVRNQRTRWGSCGRDGHICLNWRLVLMPDWVRDYVLIHELMHLRRLDHSAAYWRLVSAACPAYQDARRWLRTNGPGLR